MPMTVHSFAPPLQNMMLTSGDTMHFVGAGLAPGVAAQTGSETMNPVTADLLSDASLYESALF